MRSTLAALICVFVAFGCSRMILPFVIFTMATYVEADKPPVCGINPSGLENRLSLDKACLQIQSMIWKPLVVRAQSLECVGCDPWVVWSGNPSTMNLNQSTLIVNTTWTSFISVSFENKTQICNATYHFGQYGMYGMDVENNTTCSIYVENGPVYSSLPILWAFLIFGIIKLFWELSLRAYNDLRVRRQLMRRYLHPDDVDDILGGASNAEAEPEDTEPIVENTAAETKKKERVKSLDVFRGLSIVIMIFVNYGGGNYWFFNHSIWNGLTVADLVFPWFMWIMGVSMVIALQSKLRNSVPRKALLKMVLKRSAILFFLGLMVNSLGGHNDLRTLRIPGVLQRFAVCYFAVASIEALLMPREFPTTTDRWYAPVRDVTISAYQWFIMLSLIALHTCLTFLLPVPGCPTGYLGPGGLHDHGQHANCTGGSAMYIDIMVFGKEHIYGHPTAKKVYDTNQSFDPEGLLGCITSIFLVFLGVQAGKTLLMFPNWKERLQRWLAWSLVTGIIAGALCGFSKEGGVIPVNKNLWSLSYVFAMASMAFFLFSLMYIIIDVLKLWTGSPLQYAGMNSILLYVGHETCEDIFPFSWKPYTRGHSEILFMDLWGMSLWVAISYVLFKKKLFLSL